MRIIEIQPLENGGHRNQTGLFFDIPDGWAEVPDNVETHSFPFGEIEVEDQDIIEIEMVDGEEVEKVIGTKKVVTKWTPGTIPEPEPTPEAEEKIILELTREQYDKLMSLLA